MGFAVVVAALICCLSGISRFGLAAWSSGFALVLVVALAMGGLILHCLTCGL